MNKFEKALENIRKVMRTQDEEFRRESGLEPRQPKPEPKIPNLWPEPEPEDSQKVSGAKRDPKRFLKKSIEPKPAHEPAAQTQDTAPEFVEVIQQKDSRHSWLYNEVAKAVQNASGDNPNTKVVAVFVPVVQSGHEFVDLPAHETVELPPVHEEDFRSDDDIDIQDDAPSTDSEPQESQEPIIDDAETIEPEMPEELSAEPEQAEHLDELIPESIEHPDPELAKAYNTIEEKLDEGNSAEQEQPQPELEAENSETLSEFSAEDSEALPDTDFIAVEDSKALPDLPFPAELEDYEVIDDIDEPSEDRNAI